MKILCANPKIEFEAYKSEILESIDSVYNSGIYIGGEQTENLEYEFSEFNKSKYAIAVSNGTTAIELVLRALERDEKDEVITVSHTAVPTVAAIELANYKPHLIDIDSDTFTLCPNALKKAISEKTKAVILVHLYGQPAYIEEIIDICKSNNVILIEDCSQSHGAKWKTTKVGNFGIAGCFSCYPTKNLGALGDAGLITTNNTELYNKIKLIKEYGWKDRGYSIAKGGNYRIDEIQSAVLRIKLKYLDDMNESRLNSAHMYSNLLSDEFITPKRVDHSSRVYHLYVIKTKARDWYIEKLKKKGIFAGIHYRTPVHKSPAYSNIKIGDLVNTESISDEILSLPLYPGISDDEIKYISNSINTLAQ